MMHLAIAVNTRDYRIIPRLISLVTFSAAYHTEFVFSDGIALTASASEGIKFVERFYDRYKWVILPLPWIDERGESNTRSWAERIVNSSPKYDYIGAIFGRLWNSLEDPNKWFCSEICAKALAPYIPPFMKERWYAPKDIWKITADYLALTKPEYVVLTNDK